jgi:hypothetical protein
MYFKYLPHKLKDFYLIYKDKARPLTRLKDWICKWEEGKDLYEELKDSIKMAKSLRASFFKRGE